LESATAVFSGKVSKIEDVGEHELAVTVEVASAWKGVAKEVIVVHTAKDGATCGYHFEKGKAYLIYASGKEREKETILSASLCSRTRLLADADEDVKELGPADKLSK
jgi:hypothetical protein